MDWLLWDSLRFTILPWVVLSYDIMCQYKIKFWDRMWSQFGGGLWKHVLEDEGLGFSWLIPKFHLPAHIQGCWEIFNYNYEKWTGHTDGEGVERGWPQINSLAKSAREMTPGSWHDLLEDHVGDANWKKITGLGVYAHFE